MSTTESDWSHFTAETPAELGWEPVTGDRIAPGSGERESWADLVIPSRLAAVVRELNPLVPTGYLDEAVASIVEVKSNDAITENQRTHDWMLGGSAASPTSTRRVRSGRRSTTRPPPARRAARSRRRSNACCGP